MAGDKGSHAPGRRYVRAAERIPAGETRSFAELAAAAGKHGAARAAGRAMASVPSGSRLPWHRVVYSDGGLARDAERAAEQLRRLRREGARPREGERLAAWARRRGLEVVGEYRSQRYARHDDARVAGWDPRRVEGFARERDALARRFLHLDAEPVPPPELPSARASRAKPDPAGLARRLARLDWDAIRSELLERGLARVPRLLRAADCEALLAAGSSPTAFDRTTDMEPKGYGVGRYQYWKEPCPEPAATLRAELYARLAPVADEFASRSTELPDSLDLFWRRCREAGQRRPSSILIGYGPGGVNHAHRDVYGPVAFPLQALVVLSRRGHDFEGGDFVLWRELPDGDLEATDVPADRGDLVLFATSRVPSATKGRATPVLHGMRTLTRGTRYALGLVFHLAE